MRKEFKAEKNFHCQTVPEVPYVMYGCWCTPERVSLSSLGLVWPSLHLICRSQYPADPAGHAVRLAAAYSDTFLFLQYSFFCRVYLFLYILWFMHADAEVFFCSITHFHIYLDWIYPATPTAWILQNEMSPSAAIYTNTHHLLVYAQSIEVCRSIFCVSAYQYSLCRVLPGYVTSHCEQNLLVFLLLAAVHSSTGLACIYY